MRLPQLVAALACLVCVPACGDDSPAPVTVTPTPVPTPTPPPVVESVPVISGNWLGSAEMQFNGVKNFAIIRMQLTQSDRGIRGSWTYDPPWVNWGGQLEGVLVGVGADTIFSGSSTMDGEIASGTGRCRGRMTLSGSVSAISLRWTAPSVTSENCSGAPAGIVWILGR